MQKLHLVGFTTDHRALILSARRGAKSGGFLLEVDEAVAAAVNDAAQRAAAEAADRPEQVSPEPPARPQSALSVRELQARLRAGRSIDEVAADAGVEPAWVARFAAPVLAEQARVVDTARTATLARARLGPSALPLGAAVRRNLADKGLVLTASELEGAWSARQLDDGRWLVTLRYTSRGRTQTPSWELDIRRGTLQARDRLAGELGFVVGAPRPAARAVAKPQRAPATEPSELDRAAARRVSEARRTAAAQLDQAARDATQRNAEVARRARPESKQPKPAPAATAAGPKPAKPKARKPKATKPKPAKPKRPASKRPAATRQAATRQAATRQAAPPQPGDAVAEALAAVRRELEDELTAFESRRARPAPVPEPHVEPAPPFDPAADVDPEPDVEPEPETRVEPEPESEPERSRRREGRVVRTPIDLDVLDELGGRGLPVFRGDVAPAGSAAGNGSSPDPVPQPPLAPPRAPHPPSRPARPRRTQPLRGR